MFKTEEKAKSHPIPKQNPVRKAEDTNSFLLNLRGGIDFLLISGVRK